MEYIYDLLATGFGHVMNWYYMLLDYVGLPYLWLCIVLFSVTTRLIFVPQKIKASRKSVLAPCINYELNKLKERYGVINKKDKEKLTQYKKDSKAIFKKYNVSSGTGCLVMLLQLPVLVGLFRVIKEPFRYVPQLAQLTAADKAAVTDFFGLSLEDLPQAFGAFGMIIPAAVLICSLIKAWPALFSKKTKKQPAVIILQCVSILLLTWMSFCFPIAISLYWVVNDLTNMALAALIKNSLENNQKIKDQLAATRFLVDEDKLLKEKASSQNNNREVVTNVPANLT